MFIVPIGSGEVGMPYPLPYISWNTSTFCTILYNTVLYISDTSNKEYLSEENVDL